MREMKGIDGDFVQVAEAFLAHAQGVFTGVVAENLYDSTLQSIVVQMITFVALASLSGGIKEDFAELARGILEQPIMQAGHTKDSLEKIKEDVEKQRVIQENSRLKKENAELKQALEKVNASHGPF